jgi:hypothetical protein
MIHPELAGAATTTSVAAMPAPAAAPSRNGSASGLRNTPWNAAPATASAAPTSPPSTTRGTRICQMIAASCSDSGEVPPVSWAMISRATRSVPSPAAPISVAPVATTSRTNTEITMVAGVNRVGRDTAVLSRP